MFKTQTGSLIFETSESRYLQNMQILYVQPKEVDLLKSIFHKALFCLLHSSVKVLLKSE